MKETDRSSLRNPTPIPGIKNPDPPQPQKPQTEQPGKPAAETAPQPEEAKVPQTPPKKKKSGGLIIGLVLAAAAAVGGMMLFGSGNSVCRNHQWEYVACDKPMICGICGEVQDGIAGHRFVGGSCTEPKVCDDCGVKYDTVAGHQFVDGVCAVCGEEEKIRIQKWEDKGFEADYQFQPMDMTLRVSAPGKDGFMTDTILFKDYTGNPVNPERYTVERGSDGYVTLHLPKNLAPGRYTVCSGYFETEVAEVWLGRDGEFMAAAHDQWYADFETRSWKRGRWLADNASEVLMGVADENEATRYATAWQICTIVENGTDAILSKTESPSKLVVDEYRRFHSDGTEETVVTFTYGKWYLAMGEYFGEVYLTDTLSDDCFWVITSSM